MKAPRILRYTWEDLTSPEEIDNIFIDEIRRILLLIKANGSDKEFLQYLFNSQAGYILTCPSSDFCVILYRLLKDLPEEVLKTTIAIHTEFMFDSPHEDGPTMSMFQFLKLVESCFTIKPIPLVSGEVPRIDL